MAASKNNRRYELPNGDVLVLQHVEYDDSFHVYEVSSQILVEPVIHLETKNQQEAQNKYDEVLGDLLESFVMDED